MVFECNFTYFTDIKQWSWSGQYLWSNNFVAIWDVEPLQTWKTFTLSDAVTTGKAHIFLAHLSRSDKVSFCDRPSSVVYPQFLGNKLKSSFIIQSLLNLYSS